MIADIEILDTYQDIAAVTGRMLDAARGARWDELIELERDCGALFSRLAQLDAGDAPHGIEFQRRKAELVRRVLDDDAAIRLLVDPWLAELQALLGQAARRQRLDAAYGADE